MTAREAVIAYKAALEREERACTALGELEDAAARARTGAMMAIRDRSEAERAMLRVIQGA